MALCNERVESSRLKSRRPRLSIDIGALNRSVADYGEGLLARSAVDALTVDGSRDLSAEFIQLDDLFDAQRRGPRPRQLPFNQLKDYCQSVLPYEEFRAQTVDGDYVNASLMQGLPGPSFIAAQGPMEQTVDDFWSMIVKNRATQIVALCRDEECENYLPSTNEPLSLLGGSLKVQFKSAEALTAGGCAWSRILEVTYGEETWEVTRIHCSTWDDQGTISVAQLLQLAELVGMGAAKGTTVVHCRAGAGRTGVLIALCSLLADLETQMRKLPQQTPCTSIARTVVEMRRRRPHMVQTSGQYELLYTALREWYGARIRPQAACEHEEPEDLEQHVERSVSNNSLASTVEESGRRVGRTISHSSLASSEEDSLSKEDNISVASTATSLRDFLAKDDIASVATTPTSLRDFFAKDDIASVATTPTSLRDCSTRFGSKTTLFGDADEDALPLLSPLR